LKSLQYALIGIGVLLISVLGILLFSSEPESLTIQSEEKNFQEFKDINFALVGDVGTTPNSEKTLQNIELVDPEMIFFVGDLSYSTPEDWFEFADFLGVKRTFITTGDHDKPQDEYMKHYGLEKNFYSLDYENVHFIALSLTATRDDTNESEQYKFLESNLKTSSEDPNIDWIIVFFHSPLYSSADSDFKIPNFRLIYQPLFDLYGVDLVVSGHIHAYERTQPLKFNEIITDESDFSYVNPEGQIYVTVGSGGINHYKFSKTSDWVVVQNDVYYGFLNIKLSSNGEILTGEFITNKQTIGDKFQICSSVKKLSETTLDDDNLSGIDFSCTDLSGVDLSSKDLSGTDLSGHDLSGKNLTGTFLAGADLFGTNFTNVDLSGKDLSYTNLSNVDLSGKDLTGTILVGAHLFSTDLSGVDLSSTDLTETFLVGADLSGADLSGLDLYGKDLTGANLVGTKLSDVNLRYTDLSGANLSNVDLSGKNLTGTILVGADLSGADLSNVDLSGKDLTGTILVGAHLSGADLSNVDLSLANLSNVDISGVNFFNTILTNANLSGVDLSGKDLSYTNLSNVDLSGKNLTGTILVGVLMDDTNLSGANLSHTNFAKAGFQFSNLSNTDLSNANFAGVFATVIIEDGAQLASSREAVYDGIKALQLTTNVQLVDYETSGNDLKVKIINIVTFIDVDLSGSDLTNANLSNTYFSNVDLSNTDLSGANLSGTNLLNVTLEGTKLDCLNHPICN